MRAMLLLFLLLPVLIEAQQRYAIEEIRDEHGSPIGDVNGIFQDPDGFIWFTSNHGIYRYDGIDLVKQNSDVDEFGSPSSSVVEYAYMEEDGTMWCLTHEGLVVWKDGKRPFTLPIEQQDFFVYAGQVTVRDGTAYISTSDGIHTLDPSTLNIERLPDSPYMNDARYEQLLSILGSDAPTIAELSSVGNISHDQISFTLDEPVTALITANSEFAYWMPAYSDYGYLLLDSDTVWRSVADRGFSTGARKNYLNMDTISLMPGNYLLGFKTDGSHAYDSWNEVPPCNADSYGIQLYEVDAGQILSLNELRSQCRFEDYVMGGWTHALTLLQDGTIMAVTESHVNLIMTDGVIRTYPIDLGNKAESYYQGMTTGFMGVSLLEQPDGTVLITGFGTLQAFDPNSGTLTSVKIPEHFGQHLKELVHAPDGHIWVITDWAVHECVLTDNELEVVHTYKDDDYMQTLFMDRSGVIWLGSSKGVYKLKPTRFNTYNIPIHMHAGYLGEESYLGLSDSHVFFETVTHQFGILDLESGSIDSIDLQATSLYDEMERSGPLQMYENLNLGNQSLIKHIHVLNDQYVLAVTANKHLALIDHSVRIVVKQRELDLYVNGIIHTSAGYLMIALEGPYSLNPFTLETVLLTHHDLAPEQLVSLDYSYPIEFMSADFLHQTEDVLYYLYMDGLYKFDLETHDLDLVYLHESYFETRLNSGPAVVIDGRLIYAGNYLLYDFDLATGDMRKTRLLADRRVYSYSQCDVSMFNGDPLVVVNYLGLMHYDLNGNHRFINESQGLMDNRVINIANTPDGIWVSSTSGLTLITESGSILNHRLTNDVPMTSIDQSFSGTIESLPDGRPLFMGRDAITIVNENRATPPPLVQLINFNLAGYDIESVAEIGEFEFDQNDLLFEYCVLDFHKPLYNAYAYRLEGYKDDWVHHDHDDRKVRITNLPPGTYSLSIKGANVYGIWSEPIEVVTFTIAMPFWNTWWFVALIVLSIVLIAFAVFRIRTRALRRRQMELENTVEERTREIRHQKHIVEEKNAEILDSITYAKRIQEAILPPSRLVKEWLPNSFVLYKPKDIVAGDFYWMDSYAEATESEGVVLFAAADCTGHGVPGAMVSVVCHNAMNRSVREFGLTDPGDILNKTRELVLRTFEKSEEDVKDGMDIALCALHTESRDKDQESRHVLKYAGANNPLWIIRKGEIIETKADKQPIGLVDDPQPFTTHSFSLEPGDAFYIFSDGYVDQFGGDRGKKFKARAFRDLLLSLQEKSMDEQRSIIDQNFEDWRGDLEQVDDVCVIGVRV